MSTAANQPIQDNLIACQFGADTVNSVPGEPGIPAAAAALDSTMLKKHGLLGPREVDKICSQQTRSSGLVEGLIARRSVSVLIGDSGLGKSPLAYQLGLCVAAGIPFLGLQTQRGRVVYAEYENGMDESRELRDQLVKFLGLSSVPDNFILWTPDCGQQLSIEGICRDVKPALLIIDSLRSYNPSFEKSDNAGQEMSSLRSSAYKYGVAVLVVHHIRKPGQDGVPALDSDDTVLMSWLNQAAGHRSIINQADTRIAADLPKRISDAAMVLRWHRRLKGEGGPIYLQRDFDQGEPLGYRRMTGVELLSNPDQQNAFRQLPDSFTFRQAKAAYGRADNPTDKMLRKCMDLGILRQPKARGPYEKVSTAIPAPDPAPDDNGLEQHARDKGHISMADIPPASLFGPIVPAESPAC
jgi:hypothetical protein